MSKEALANEALDKKAENAKALGLDYEPAQPYKGIADHINQATNGRMRIDPVTGDVGIGTPSQQPAQRPWVGLTHEEKRQIFEREDYQGWLDYINAIEAKIKQRNT
jgi:hypothetical protein